MKGWLLDLYPDATDGLVLWLLGTDGRRHRLYHNFPITLYASGPFPRLRQLWRFLKEHPQSLTLARTRREDLFAGWLDVLAITLPNPAPLPKLFATIQRHFPDLDYYDADIPLSLRYQAEFGVFPLAFCEVEADENGRLHHILPLDIPWELHPTPPPLRILIIEPNSNTACYKTAVCPSNSSSSPKRLAANLMPTVFLPLPLVPPNSSPPSANPAAPASPSASSTPVGSPASTLGISPLHFSLLPSTSPATPPSSTAPSSKSSPPSALMNSLSTLGYAATRFSYRCPKLEPTNMA